MIASSTNATFSNPGKAPGFAMTPTAESMSEKVCLRRAQFFEIFREVFRIFSLAKICSAAPKKIGKYKWHRWALNRPKILEIGAILAMVRPFATLARRVIQAYSERRHTF